MNKFTSGLIAGSLLGAAGLSYALSDKRMRKKMSRDSKKVINKANGLIENISDMF